MEDDGDESWEDEAGSNSTEATQSDVSDAAADEDSNLQQINHEVFNAQWEEKSKKHAFSYRNMKNFFKVDTCTSRHDRISIAMYLCCAGGDHEQTHDRRHALGAEGRRESE